MPTQSRPNPKLETRNSEPRELRSRVLTFSSPHELLEEKRTVKGDTDNETMATP